MLKIFTSNEALWLLYLLVNYIFITVVYRFLGKNGLLAFIPISIILANIQVNKLVVLFGLETTLGNIAYASIFLVSDILSENYGKKEASKTIVLGFFTLIFTTIVMNLALMIHPSSSDTAQVSLQAIFGPFSRYTVASLMAFMLSSATDITLYQIIRRYLPSFANIWIRNNFSTLFSQIVDNVIFTFIAFLGVYDIKIVISIAFSTYFLKVLCSLFDTPFVYIGAYMKNKGLIKE